VKVNVREVKRRSAQFMRGKGFSIDYIANQLNLSVSEVKEMLGEPTPPLGPSEGIKNEFRRMDREKRRDAKDPLAKLWKPETEVTFVPAFVGEVEALTEKQETARRKELATIRERESRDAGEGRRG
jgi:hypothetical protein